MNPQTCACAQFVQTDKPWRVVVMVATLIWLTGSIQVVGDENSRGKTKSSTQIPELARLAGIEVGISTQEDLAGLWGNGKTVIGGHPNSGRVWKVQGTNWVIESDGFEYSKRGLVIDSVTLGVETGNQTEHDVPISEIGRTEWVWLDQIRLGMTSSAVKNVLRSHKLPLTKTPTGISVQVAGFHRLETATFHRWEAELKFEGDRLIRLVLSARE